MKKNVFYQTIIICLLGIFALNTAAEQLHFSKIEQNNGYQFNYQWRDHNNSQQSMSFTLSKAALFERFRSFRTYKAEFAKKAIFQAMNTAWQSSAIDGVQVTFPNTKGQNNISVNGVNPQNVTKAYQKLTELEQQSTANYLAANFYHKFTTHQQISAIKPNHVQIANAAVADIIAIKPLILKNVSNKNIRTVTDYVLSFIQSIPYSDLESRVSSSGAGFNPPLKVLWENQGDCDSKVTLTASLLRLLMPKIPMVLVFVDKHALIGLAVPAKEGELTIVKDELTYVLAEPTGPALFSLGHISGRSEQAILSGHYITEKY